LTVVLHYGHAATKTPPRQQSRLIEGTLLILSREKRGGNSKPVRRNLQLAERNCFLKGER
jgi:hypothetical protein